MLMLDVDHLAGDAGCLRCVGDGDENFLACSRMRVLYWTGVSSSICVSVVNTNTAVLLIWPIRSVMDLT
jgi:hypothetical protein